MRRNQKIPGPASAVRTLRLIERLARAAVRKQHVGPIMQNLAESLVSEFGFGAVVVTQFAEQTGSLKAVGVAPRALENAAVKILGTPVSDFEFTTRIELNRIFKDMIRGKTWVGRNLGEVLKPAIRPGLARTLQKALEIKCLYKAPLFGDRKFLGTLLVGTRRDEFTGEELAVLRVITHHAALAAHQACLLEENKSKARQYRLLSEVDGQILEQKQLQKVLHAIVSNIRRVIPCDLSGVYLHDPRKNSMVYAVAWPRSDYARKLRHFEFPVGKGVIGTVARTRRPEILNHAERDVRSVYPPGSVPDLEHLLCLPLVGGRRLLGVLYVARYHDRPFVKEDLEVAQQFGEKSALAIENAQLFAHQQARRKDMEGLQQSGTRIAGSLDLEDVLDAVLREALRLVPSASDASLALVEGTSRALVLAAGTAHRARTGDLKERVRLLASKAVRLRKSVTTDGSEGRAAAPMLTVPLTLKDRVLGVLILEGRRGYTFSPGDVGRLELFALHAALAVRNAHLHASIQQEIKKIKLLRDIKSVARVGFSSETFLKNVCDLMVEAYGYHLTAILLLDPTRRSLRLVAASGSEARRVRPDYEQSLDEGVVGWVARTGRTRLVQDASRDRYFINKNKLSTRSELCVPILMPSGVVLGVINTESNRLHAFKETDIQVQLAVASEIAGAFEERRLLTALRDSERKYRRLFEESKDAIYVSTMEGKLLDANQAAVDLFGFGDKDELLGVEIGKDLYWDPRDRKKLLQHLQQAGFVKDVELRLKKKTGDLILVNASITGIRDAHGALVAMQGILHDVTGQKEDERRVHESEEKYRSLVEGSIVGVYIIQDDRFAFVNHRFGEIFGYSVDEITKNLSVEDLVHPGDRRVVMENIRLRLTGTVKTLRYSFRGLRKDGGQIEVEVLGTRSVYQGRPAVIGTLLDRTQEHLQQKEIDAWRRRYELIIASSAQIVYEYDIASGRILWGGSVEQVLGYRPEELRGDIREWEELIHPDDRSMALHELDRAIAAMKPYDVVYRYRRKDGTFAWIHDRGFVVPDETGWAHTMLGMLEDITQARELESKLHYSELKYRLLFEHAIDAVLVLKGEVIIESNPRALDMFGAGREDLIGQTLYAFTPPHQVDGTESKAALLAHIRAGLEGQQRRFTWRHIRRNGTPFEAEVRMIPFELEGEKLLQVQVRDITAEAEAQEEIARSEETYRRLVLEASDAILVSDGEGRLVEANDAACTMLGYSREELLRLSVADLSDLPREEGFAKHREFYARLIGEDRVTNSEQVLRRKDGTRFPCEVSAALLGNGLLQSILRDVSVKKQEEKELDTIYTMVTTSHGLELFDRAAAGLAQILGTSYVSVGEIIGGQMRALVLYNKGVLERGFSHRFEGSPCEAILSTRESCFVERRAGERFREDPLIQKWGIEAFGGVPMLGANGDVIGVVSVMDTKPHAFTDHEKKMISVVVQRLASELEMFAQRKREEQLSLQLLQAQKMESLGTLAGGVAHDFNNILGAVIGYTNLIRKRLPEEEQVSRYLEAIEKSAQRAASLSKQLLSFSHKSQGKIERVEVNTLVRDTIHILESSFPKTISITTDLADSLPSVQGDANLLGQVLMNLCINARDAIEESRRAGSGMITITTSHLQAPSGFVDVHLSAAPGDYVSVSVKDNGSGMKPEVKERIFEPFFTTKGKGRGTGLGLAMVYGIVRNHAGFIDVRTEQGAGTEFKVYLPASLEGIRDEEPRQDEIPRGDGEVLLVVEDEPMLRELLVDVLSGHGYVAVTAGNGREAVDRYSREKERISLVILDMIMPEMDGTATFRALRAVNPSLKILISSGFSQDRGVQQLLSEGASGFIAKPYQTDELLKAVASQVRGNHA